MGGQHHRLFDSAGTGYPTLLYFDLFCTVSDSVRLIFWLSVMHYESAGPFLNTFASTRLTTFFSFPIPFGRAGIPALHKDRSLTAQWADAIWLKHFRSSILLLHRIARSDPPGRELWPRPLPQGDLVRLVPLWYRVPAGWWADSDYF